MQRQAHIATQRSLPRQGGTAFVGAEAVFAMNARHGNDMHRQRPVGPLGGEDGSSPGKGGA